MFNEIGLPRSFLIGATSVAVALLLGFLLANPLSLMSIALVGLMLGALCLPLMMHWHHALLIFCWNASLIFFFLPGQPPLWVLLACVSLFFSVLTRTVRSNHQFIHIRSVAWPLVLLAGVIIGTAVITGGIGSRALGSEAWGGKRYLTVLGAIVGYFALVAQRVPRNQAVLFASLFFLSGVTAVFSDLAYAGGPSFYFLYAFFPAELAFHQATSQEAMYRFTGAACAAQAGCLFLLLRYGIRGTFDLRHFWRLAMFLLLIAIALLGGFRSTIVVLGLLFGIQFYLEGLFRSRLLPILLVSGILVAVFTVALVDRLPLSVQRSLSFIPFLEIDAVAKHDAMGTLDWRFQMWKTLLPEVGKYFWLGKGFSFSGTDFLLTQEAVRRGLFTAYEDTLINGNYHNGPLTLIIPFGIGGVLAFLAFCCGAWRVLHRNYLYGDPALKRINTFLLAYFTARLLFYFGLYGQFDLDLMVFTGIVGMSIALNGRVSRPRELAPQVENRLSLVPIELESNQRFVQ